MFDAPLVVQVKLQQRIAPSSACESNESLGSVAAALLRRSAVASS